MTHRVHLVDGTYELFRAFYGAPSARAPDGREVGACRGLARSLLALLSGARVTHVACAYDHVIESFRNELFDGYKTGEGIEPELMAQFELAEAVTRGLGISCWPMVEFEADDALATGARRFAAEPEVEQVVLCSPDKDLAQCVVAERVVCLDRMRRRVLDAPGVEQKFGVRPVSIPDYLALVGDSADGIPGVPRWGAKSAAAVLARYGHIEAIPADVARWDVAVRGASALSKSLEAMREEVALYRTLATLRTDVPLLEVRSDALLWEGPDLAALETVAHQLGDSEIVERAVALRPRR